MMVKLTVAKVLFITFVVLIEIIEQQKRLVYIYIYIYIRLAHKVWATRGRECECGR